MRRWVLLLGSPRTNPLLILKDPSPHLLQEASRDAPSSADLCFWGMPSLLSQHPPSPQPQLCHQLQSQKGSSEAATCRDTARRSLCIYSSRTGDPHKLPGTAQALGTQASCSAGPWWSVLSVAGVAPPAVEFLASSHGAGPSPATPLPPRGPFPKGAENTCWSRPGWDSGLWASSLGGRTMTTWPGSATPRCAPRGRLCSNAGAQTLRAAAEVRVLLL